jgi:hypothetical protein
MDQVVLSVSVHPPDMSGVELQVCLAEELKLSVGHRKEPVALRDASEDMRSAEDMSI